MNDTPPPLSVAAEFLLLLLDDSPGTIPELPFGALGVSLAGAVLMQLALDRRIDSDLHALLLVDATPTGDRLSDAALMQISLADAAHPTAWWLELLAQRREEYLAILTEELVARGVLRIVDHRALWTAATRLYPADGVRPGQAVRTRLAALLLGEELPDPQDAMLVALAGAAGILPRMLTARELWVAQSRIDQFKALEEIGRSVTVVAAEVLEAIERALPLV